MVTAKTVNAESGNPLIKAKRLYQAHNLLLQSHELIINSSSHVVPTISLLSRDLREIEGLLRSLRRPLPFTYAAFNGIKSRAGVEMEECKLHKIETSS